MRLAVPITAAALVAAALGGVAIAEETSVPTIHTKWKKFCFSGQDTKRICNTRAEVRRRDDHSVVGAIDLLDREGETRRVLRVTFPLGMQLQHGTRVVVLGNDPLRSSYVTCTAKGCFSDYEVTPAFLDSMIGGQWLLVQAIDASAKPLNAQLSLADFWAVYDNPPREPVIDQIIEPSRPWLDDTLRPELRPPER